MRALVIVNPAAGKTCKYWPAIREVLEQGEHEFDVQFTEGRGDATTIAKEAKNFDVVVSVGGDGTLNEVVNGIFGKDVVVSVVPTGNGNDFARSAGLFTDYMAASRNIFSENIREIDVGSLSYDRGSRYFIEVAGVGFDGLISKTTSRIDKPKLGSIPHILGALRHLAEYRSVEVTLTIDEKTFEQDLIFVDVANGKYVGCGLPIAPHAEVDDGLFDVIVIGDFGKIESLIRLPTLYLGTHINDPRVRVFRGKHIEVHSETPLSIHAEGEYVGQTPAVFDIHEKALKVRAP